MWRLLQSVGAFLQPVNRNYIWSGFSRIGVPIAITESDKEMHFCCKQQQLPGYAGLKRQIKKPDSFAKGFIAFGFHLF